MLSTRLKEKEEFILKVLEQLAEENAAGKPILVEGTKDEESLRKLGIEGRILFAKTGGKSLIGVIDELEDTSVREVILLLDFDRKGKELTENLKKHLEKSGIKVNMSFWDKLLGLIGREVKDVEGLAAYMETLKSKISNS